jgi:hypothetical protein
MYRLTVFLTALLIGVIAGTIADSSVVAGLAALAFATTWAYFDRFSGGRKSR